MGVVSFFVFVLSIALTDSVLGVPRGYNCGRGSGSRYVRLRVADANRGKILSILSSGKLLNSQKRFGQAIVSSGTLNIRHKAFAQDFDPIDKDCTCTCCRPTEQGGLGITRAYMYHVAAKETVGAHL